VAPAAEPGPNGTDHGFLSPAVRALLDEQGLELPAFVATG